MHLISTGFVTCWLYQESLRLSRMTRFYIKQKEDPHGPHIAIYVSCLPTSLSQRQYEHILLDMIGRGLSAAIRHVLLATVPRSWLCS